MKHKSRCHEKVKATITTELLNDDKIVMEILFESTSITFLELLFQFFEEFTI
jgi:hypothetical protein